MPTLFRFFPLILPLAFSPAVMAEVTKDELIKHSAESALGSYCGSEKFLGCLKDSEQTCRSQMQMFVFPACVDSRISELPESMSDELADESREAFHECATKLYVELNSMDYGWYRICMKRK